MITHLSIENYALISSLGIELNPGLTIITGETGAGKSILLGALSLLLGTRAGAEVQGDAQRPCIIEGSFTIVPAAVDEAMLRALFSEAGQPYETDLILRRMILPGGRSRCFVNDIPVNLAFLKQLAPFLVDIHAQHQNLLLEESAYQLCVLDFYADAIPDLEAYRTAYEAYSAACRERETLREALRKEREEADYTAFRLQKLTEAHLRAGELESLEQEAQVLHHAAEIKETLYRFCKGLSEGEEALLSKVYDYKLTSERLARLLPSWHDVAVRWDSLRIEMQDLAEEAQSSLERLTVDPHRLEQVQERLDVLYSLLRQFHVGTVEELMAVRDDLSARCDRMEVQEEAMAVLEKQCADLGERKRGMAEALHKRRVAAAPQLGEELEGMLAELEMPFARVAFKVEHLPEDGLQGCSRVEWLFSANRQVAPAPLSKVASGGELSRMMLCVKYLLAKARPTACLVFDEIDLGISGRTADKIGRMIAALAERMQVVTISHLPQVAAKGGDHLLVYKTETASGTQTCLKVLDAARRVDEIARLLSGDEVTPEARAQARILLNMN